jgi:hypothetical protein
MIYILGYSFYDYPFFSLSHLERQKKVRPTLYLFFKSLPTQGQEWRQCFASSFSPAMAGTGEEESGI